MSLDSLASNVLMCQTDDFAEDTHKLCHNSPTSTARFSPQGLGFNPSRVVAGFVLDKVAVGLEFLRVLRVSPANVIQSLLLCCVRVCIADFFSRPRNSVKSLTRYLAIACIRNKGVNYVSRHLNA